MPRVALAPLITLALVSHPPLLPGPAPSKHLVLDPPHLGQDDVHLLKVDVPAGRGEVVPHRWQDPLV
ncbi:MAG: hypothetical protein ACO4BJ_08740, partial [Planctomycetota bacterium]